MSGPADADPWGSPFPSPLAYGAAGFVLGAGSVLAGQRIRRLPVMARGKMVGLLSRSDVLDFFAHTHWTCTVCGNMERGLEQPEACPQCGNKEFHLDRAHPGH